MEDRENLLREVGVCLVLHRPALIRDMLALFDGIILFKTRRQNITY